MKGTAAFAAALTRLFRDRRALLLFIAVYVSVGLAFVMTDYALNDEGLCIHIFGSWARHDFVPVFFFQKAKPVLELVYLLPSAGGIRSTMAVHVVLAALAVPMIAAVARALGHANPNFPALVLAFSPVYFFGGPSGIENVDGVLGTTLFLYLLVVRRSPFLAGAILGMLPWVRSELALLTGIFFLRALLIDRNRRLAVGALAFPILFFVAGTIYHRDPLWLLHFPPATAKPMPGNPMWVPVTASQMLQNLLSVSPLAALACAVRVKRLDPLERTLAAFGAAWFLCLTVLPVLRLANFGFVGRYALQLLPVVAILASRSLERWQSGELPGPGDAACAAALCVLWLVPRDLMTGVAFALVAVVLVLALARLRRPSAALAVAVVATCAGPLLPQSQDLTTNKVAAYLAPMTEWVADNRSRLTGPVYTNAQLLAPHLASARDIPGLDIRYMVGVDIYYELVRLTNSANGQTAAIIALAGRQLYGPGVMPDAVVPDRIPDGAVFLLRADQRLDLLMAPAEWQRHFVPLTRQPSFRAMRFERHPTEVAPPGRKQ